MAEHKVLITTSGIGSRLGKLTDFTNKSLVRIGDKPAISHIIEYYSEDTSFVISITASKACEADIAYEAVN